MAHDEERIPQGWPDSRVPHRVVGVGVSRTSCQVQPLADLRIAQALRKKSGNLLETGLERSKELQLGRCRFHRFLSGLGFYGSGLRSADVIAFGSRVGIAPGTAVGSGAADPISTALAGEITEAAAAGFGLISIFGTNTGIWASGRPFGVHGKVWLSMISDTSPALLTEWPTMCASGGSPARSVA